MTKKLPMVKPPAGESEVEFKKRMLARVHKLTQQEMTSRERTRSLMGAKKEALNELLNGLADGVQLEMRFGPDKEDEEDIVVDGHDDDSDGLSDAN